MRERQFKKFFIVYGHYDDNSFNAAIRDTFIESAKKDVEVRTPKKLSVLFDASVSDTADKRPSIGEMPSMRPSARSLAFWSGGGDDSSDDEVLHLDFDKDGDGMVSLEEFTDCLRKFVNQSEA